MDEWGKAIQMALETLGELIKHSLDRGVEATVADDSEYYSRGLGADSGR